MPRDDFNARKWFQRAAKNGNAEAQLFTGYYYEHEAETLGNYQEALRWYRMAADQGSAAACYFLGTMYEFGRGVSQDYPRAMDWYRRSADRHWPEAAKRLGYLYENGLGDKQNIVEAFVWYSLAEMASSGTAQYSYSQIRAHRMKLQALMTPAQLAETQKRIAKYKAAHPAK